MARAYRRLRVSKNEFYGPGAAALRHSLRISHFACIIGWILLTRSGGLVSQVRAYRSSPVSWGVHF